MLLEIRKIDIDSIDLDEAVAALAFTKLIDREYSALNVPTPDWLKEKQGELDREVKARHRDYLERALKQARQKADTYKTREQKAVEVAAEIASLERALGINGAGQAAPAP